MNRRKYDRVVEEEIRHLVKLAAEREAESRMKLIVTEVNRWKRGSVPISEALREIAGFCESSSLALVEGADPGVAAAHAVAQGFLSKRDFSESGWMAIEILVTLAEI